MGISQLFVKNVLHLVLILSLQFFSNVDAVRNSRGERTTTTSRYSKSKEAMHGWGFNFRELGDKSVGVTQYPDEAANVEAIRNSRGERRTTTSRYSNSKEAMHGWGFNFRELGDKSVGITQYPEEAANVEAIRNSRGERRTTTSRYSNSKEAMHGWGFNFRELGDKSVGITQYPEEAANVEAIRNSRGERRTTTSKYSNSKEAMHGWGFNFRELGDKSVGITQYPEEAANVEAIRNSRGERRTTTSRYSNSKEAMHGWGFNFRELGDKSFGVTQYPEEAANADAARNSRGERTSTTTKKFSESEQALHGTGFNVRKLGDKSDNVTQYADEAANVDAVRNFRGERTTTTSRYSKSKEALHGSGFEARIIGGKSVDITQYPYQAAIEYQEILLCGGAILSKKHIITAAHCCDNKAIEDLRVRVGTTLRGEGGFFHEVSDIFVDPSWGLQEINHDVAVLKLKGQIPLTRRTKSVKLPPKNLDLWPGLRATVTGWGASVENQPLAEEPKYLQAVELIIMDLHECLNRYPEMVINNLVLCVGSYTWDEDSCQGDSGGPLVMDGTLIGLVSYGEGCAHQETPAVYTNVAAVRDFIDSALKL